MKKQFIAAGCIALNLSLAKLASIFSLPVYLDSVGTILSAALLPLPLAILTGVSTSLLGGVIINPYYIPYAGTQLTIALVAWLCARAGWMKRWPSAAGSGVLIALLAVIASAPVTVLLFGGVTLSSTTAINAVLMAAGQNIWKSVIGGSVFIESIDKPAATLLAYLVLKRLPRHLLENKFSPTKKQV